MKNESSSLPLFTRESFKYWNLENAPAIAADWGYIYTIAFHETLSELLGILENELEKEISPILTNFLVWVLEFFALKEVTAGLEKIGDEKIPSPHTRRKEAFMQRVAAMKRDPRTAVLSQVAPSLAAQLVHDN